jgi:hypothetical protein
MYQHIVVIHLGSYPVHAYQHIYPQYHSHQDKAIFTGPSIKGEKTNFWQKKTGSLALRSNDSK